MVKPALLQLRRNPFLSPHQPLVRRRLRGMSEVRLALRTLLKTPVVTAVAVLSRYSASAPTPRCSGSSTRSRRAPRLQVPAVACPRFGPAVNNRLPPQLPMGRGPEAIAPRSSRAHSVRNRGVGGSNPLAPTKFFKRGQTSHEVWPLCFFTRRVPEGRGPARCETRL